jgi:histidinol dehydrogenase
VRIYRWSELDAGEQSALLARPALSQDAETHEEVARILAAVRSGGDRALLDFARRLDGLEQTSLRVSAEELAEVPGRLTDDQRNAIERAASNIETFHRAQLSDPIDMETTGGVRCERVTRPLRSVGLYVPAGSAPLPSTALMLGVPAKIAGCPIRVLCSPAQRDGRMDAGVSYAAQLVGITQIFKIGGAQAIGAMAYGTESVPKVDKVFGPGNAWVTAAKAQVSQDANGAARDLPAGPSEVLVIADGAASAEFVAADLLSQAEHGGDSQVILLTPSGDLAERVAKSVADQSRKLSREATIRESLSHSAIIIVRDVPTAVRLANDYAPEHLILEVENPRQWVPDIFAAGSVFLGPWTPESVGDYCSGTNHVLPTYGFARSYSSLGVGDFLRSMTIQELSAEGLNAIGPVAETLALLEGLDAHANAVRKRLDRLNDGNSA